VHDQSKDKEFLVSSFGFHGVLYPTRNKKLATGFTNDERREC